MPRRGCAVSEVRIIPVEYSEVITSAPITAMISWPISKNGDQRAWVASKPALLAGLCLKSAAAAGPVMAAPMPMATTSSAASVQ